MQTTSYTEWDQVRQTLDRVLRVTETVSSIDNINLSVGKLRLQLVPCARSVRVIGLGAHQVLRLPAGVTVVQTYRHHVHYLIDGFIIVENRPDQESKPRGRIHVA